MLFSHVVYLYNEVLSAKEYVRCRQIEFYFFLVAPTRGSLLPLLEHRAEFPQFLDQRQSVGLLDQIVARPLPVHKHRKTHTHTQTLNIHALSGIRNHGLGFRANEDSARLRLLGYRDRRRFEYDAIIINGNLEGCEKMVSWSFLKFYPSSSVDSRKNMTKYGPVDVIRPNNSKRALESKYIVQCYATEDTFRIVNSFYLKSHTRNYNHSQLFLTLCHIYTAYNLTRS
jgi:hypothetical protein